MRSGDKPMLRETPKIRVRIFTSDKFDLISYGFGESYALHDRCGHRSLFVQGDDALRFCANLQSWEKAFPDKSYNEIMTELCEEYSAVMEFQALADTL